MNVKTKYKNKFSLATVVIVALALTACESESNPTSEATSRLSNKNEPISVDMTGVAGYSSQSVGQAGQVGALGLLDPVLSPTPTLTLIGSIAPPIVGGLTLQASDVTVNGTKAYVAYNAAGLLAAGGVDVIDFSASGVPSLKASIVYPDTDVNKVYVDAASSKLYVAGATTSGDTGAVLNRIGLDAQGAFTAAVESKVLRSAADPTIPAYAATSVVKSGAYVYALTGSNGGISVLNDADLSDNAFTAVAEARDIGVGAASNVVVVSGKTASAEAQVQSFAAVTGAPQVGSTINAVLSGAAIDQGKASIYAGSVGYIASAGQGGAKFTCYDGYTVGAMAVPTVAGLTATDVSANAVTFGNGLVYVAQGAAGVYIYSVERTLVTVGCTGYSLQYRGKFMLGGRSSANNVYYSNGYLVVATGLGGFQIIHVVQSTVAGLLQSI